jgi:hypothetical protein
VARKGLRLGETKRRMPWGEGATMGRRLVVAVIATVGIVGAHMSSAAAMTVKHETSSFDGTIAWSCPGPNPLEHYTLTTHTTTFFVAGTRVRVIAHQEWRGWITNRDTGELMRDAGNWSNVYTYEGRHVVRGVTTGVIWRFTVPGHGIIVHQSGRSVFQQDGESSETPFGGFADVGQLCQYV